MPSLNYIHCCVIFLLLQVANTQLFAQDIINQSDKPSQLVAMELEFAKLASNSGLKVAFEKNLDSAGIIVVGNKLSNGLKAYARTSADTTDLLCWKPIFAAVNESNTFGFTTGPYLYHQQKGEKPTGSGYYFSIWEKDSRNEFKVKFDGGVLHDKPKNDSFLVDLPNPHLKTLKQQSKLAPPITDLLMRFNEEFDRLGNKSYQRYLSAGAVILRPNIPIFLNASQFLMVIRHQKEKKMVSLSKGNGFDQTKQLFYSYGNLANSTEASKKGVFCGYYVRIWQFQGKEWKIIADVKQYS